MPLCEEFDRPVQDYSRYAKAGLAAIALYRLNRFGIDQNGEAAADLGHDAFRLTSWVEEEDSLYGNALAISRPDDSGNNFINARFYRVNREKRQILPDYPKTIEVPRLITGIPDLKSQEGREWATDLAIHLDRDELDASVHMLTKAAAVFHASRLPAFDRYVYFALAESEADELERRFPGREEMIIPVDSTPEHILEWHDFIDLAQDRMDEEFGVGEEPQELFLQHEIGTKQYALNVYRHDGKLVSLQILCYDQGAWQGQIIELQQEIDEDDYTIGEVSPVWNRDDILRVVDQGMAMDQEMYDAYLKEAARNLGQTNNFAMSNVICLDKAPQQKRPAA